MFDYGRKILSFLVVLGSLISVGGSGPSGFQGSTAFQKTRRAVSFGERPAGSPAIQNLRAFIVADLKSSHGEVQLDPFSGQTPTGLVPMVNVICKFPGTSGRAIVVTGHYDTKRIPMTKFLGANDGASSTGFLLELARTLAPTRHRHDIYLVFFDGEEAVVNWSETDSRYGSRHLAAKWLTEGMLSRIEALINVDMIGDKNLNINNDANSSPSLRAQVQRVAAIRNYSSYFRKDQTGGIDDDHMPFVNAGVNAIDLIDFDYGPQNAYWHQSSDTTDKLSAKSFQIVGDVVLSLIQQLDAARAPSH